MSQENNRKKHDEFVRNTFANIQDAISFLEHFIRGIFWYESVH